MAVSRSPLSGKSALVTGAGKNIGRAIAMALADAGASVVINGRSNQKTVETVASRIRDAGGKAHAILADVSDEDAVEGLVEETVSTFGRLDIIVSNAGLRTTRPTVDMSYDEWRAVTSVALDGAFLLAHFGGPHLLRAGGGRFIGISGISHHAGTPNRAHVNASKAGLEGFCRGLAAEWAPAGITANTVVPGAIDTVRGDSAGSMPSGMGLDDIPAGRKGLPEEIAGAVLYLCSDAAAYVTGQSIHVNGGRIMR